MDRVLNPRTNRYIMTDKSTYNDLIRNGYTHDRRTNTLIPRQPPAPAPRQPPAPAPRQDTGSVRHLLDEDIPDINVVPLKPTIYQRIKRKVITFVKRNTNKVTDWILSLKPTNIKRILPAKIAYLIEFSKSVVYKKDIPIYWQINVPYSDDKLITEKVEAARTKHGEENSSKYLKTYYYNNIQSLDDICKCLMKTYEKEDKAFKLMISFGYVTERKIEDDRLWKPKLFHPSQQYYHDKPKIVKN